MKGLEWMGFGRYPGVDISGEHKRRHPLSRQKCSPRFQIKLEIKRRQWLHKEWFKAVWGDGLGKRKGVHTEELCHALMVYYPEFSIIKFISKIYSKFVFQLLFIHLKLHVFSNVCEMYVWKQIIWCKHLRTPSLRRMSPVIALSLKACLISSKTVIPVVTCEVKKSMNLA